MNVLFLDIDGVLNSAAYDRVRTPNDGNIDKSRLILLKEIIRSTDAKIVLSSSWRKHWERDLAACDAVGCQLHAVFDSAGLPIYDKTPVLTDRAEEIAAWLRLHPETEGYAILDDAFGGWGELQSHLVKTDYRIGRGLEHTHVERALCLLKSEAPLQ